MSWCQSKLSKDNLKSVNPIKFLFLILYNFWNNYKVWTCKKRTISGLKKLWARLFFILLKASFHHIQTRKVFFICPLSVPPFSPLSSTVMPRTYFDGETLSGGAFFNPIWHGGMGVNFYPLVILGLDLF